MKGSRIGFLASHQGSNVQAIVEACNNGRLEAHPSVVISNNSNSAVIESARCQGIPSYHLSERMYSSPDELDLAILNVLEAHRIDLVILAGYMKLLGPYTVSRYKSRIFNIHPALLPKHGGRGMYGNHVHECVLASGDTKTGVTIHLVNQDYDCGAIIAQCEVPILEGDTVETLSERVLRREHEFYVETLQRVIEGQINLDGGAVQ